MTLYGSVRFVCGYRCVGSRHRQRERSQEGARHAKLCAPNHIGPDVFRQRLGLRARLGTEAYHVRRDWLPRTASLSTSSHSGKWLWHTYIREDTRCVV